MGPELMADHTNDIRQIRRDIAELKARKPGPLDRRQSGGGTARLPEGEHQYMVAQMVSDNQLGFNYVLFHPIVSGSGGGSEE